MRKLLLVTAFSSWIIPTGFGGAIWLEVGKPEASSDPALKGALFTIRPLDRKNFTPDSCAMTAMAEGFNGSERRSIPLIVIKLDAPDTACFFAVQGNLPKEAVWGILLTLDIGGATGGKTVVPVGPTGISRKPRVLWWKPAPAPNEIEDVQDQEFRQALKMLIAVHCARPAVQAGTELGWGCGPLN